MLQIAITLIAIVIQSVPWQVLLEEVRCSSQLGIRQWKRLLGMPKMPLRLLAKAYSAPGSGIFKCIFGLSSRPCSGCFPVFFMRFFRFSGFFRLILLLFVFILLEHASNAKSNLVLVFLAARGAFLLPRSFPETSRRGRF